MKHVTPGRSNEFSLKTMLRRLKVLLADDDPVFLRLLPGQLASKNLEISTTTNGSSVLEALSKREFDVVVLDVDLPDISGIKVLQKIRSQETAPEVIMLTGDASLETGLSAMRFGAYDYITKPADPDHVFEVIQKAADKASIIKQNQRLKAAARSNVAGMEPVIEGDVSKRLFLEAKKVAPTDATILVTGESGTGKDVLASWIHSHSERSGQPLVSVNCGAVPENLAESEFFGFEKGAFTGAAKQKIGLIEAADTSTLFLDEIGEMPMPLQVKLLRFLENGVFRRVGSVKDQMSDVRIIAATNRDLATAIEDGSFRADLFYRLNIIKFDIPPLRERIEEIPHLASRFLSRFGSKYGVGDLELTDGALAQLVTYDWPGNIRELKNCLERTVALAETTVIDEIHGLNAVGTPSRKADSKKPLLPLSELEKDHILKVLQSVGGNREKAASILGITSRTLYRKIKSYKA